MRAAKSGDVYAMTQLARFYCCGFGGAVIDKSKEFSWHARAAEKGMVSSQLFLAKYFDDDQDKYQSNPKLAFKWFLKAAKHGDYYAQYKLGYAYYTGKGTHKDDNEAVKWFRKASGQGYDGSHWFLGSMYENGRGVPQSNLLAYMWFNLASKEDDSNNFSESSATAQRDRVAKKLSANEIRAAQAMSTECFNSSFKNCEHKKVFAKPEMLTVASYLGSAEFCAAYGVDYRETANRVLGGINQFYEFDDNFTKIDFNTAVENGHFGELFSLQANSYVSLSKESADIFESCKDAHLQVIKIAKAK